LTDLAERLSRGETSPLETVDESLAAIARNQPRHNAFVAVHTEAARARARALEREGGGRLRGVPVAVKDNIDEAGVVCAAGCPAYDRRIPAADAPVVGRLRAAGAVVVGRTNMNELADGVTGENPHRGDVHNPWRAGYRAGGSSAGSAAALADGSVAGALGTDTGGSVRIPAALCGVVGYKPTAGLLPTAGTLPLSTSLDHVGLMARRTLDVIALLDALLPEGLHDPRLDDRDPGAAPRIGVLEGFAEGADAGTALAFERALSRIEAGGAHLSPLTIPELAEGLGLLARIYGPEAAATHRDALRSDPGAFGDEVRADLARGGRAGAGARRQRALARSKELGDRVRAATADLDLLVSPTTPMPPTPHGEPDPHRYLSFTCPFNLTGQPAVSVPMGEVDGLPVGLQIAGAAWGDLGVLRIAAAFERA